MNILTVKNLTKKYEDIIAVDNISFQIKKGEIYGLVGPNGAGKSTTINMISGLLIPDKGNILFEDNITYQNWRSNIGLVPQDLAIYPDLSAEENISFFASLYGLKGTLLKNQVNKAIASVGLDEHRKRKVDKFSGGMKRRLNIACAIAHSPKLIIMDEPTVGIDPQSRNYILESIRKLQKNGTTIIYTSHYIEEIEEICNQVLIIDHGKIIMSGTTKEIKNNYNKGKLLVIYTDINQSVFEQLKVRLENLTIINHVIYENDAVILHCDEAINQYSTIFDCFKQFNISIDKIESKTPTLEEIFLSLTGKELRDK